MLDIKWIRENPEALKTMLVNRRSRLDVSPLIALDADRRKILTELEQLQALRNKSAEQIGKLKAQKQDATAALKDVEGFKGKIKDFETKLTEIEPKLNDLMLRINNIPDASVPVGASAADNKVMREVGKVAALPFAAKTHLGAWRVAGDLTGFFKAGAKLSGSGFPRTARPGRGAGARAHQLHARRPYQRTRLHRSVHALSRDAAVDAGHGAASQI